VRQLPSGANLRQLRNQAKDLCRACREGDPDAIRRIGDNHILRISGNDQNLLDELLALRDRE
jgi:hypothetical protein